MIIKEEMNCDIILTFDKMRRGVSAEICKEK